MEIQNIDQPNVQDLLNQFKKRHEMNVVDVAEIISKLITTLKLDFSSGRPKIYNISGGHLGQILGIGKGVVSQYLSVWNMPDESKEFLRSYNLSLINSYQVSRIKGRDMAETIKLQKESIVQKIQSPFPGNSMKDKMIHKVQKTDIILNSIISSHRIPKNIFTQPTEITKGMKLETIIDIAKTYIYNIDHCINHLSPRVQKLPYLKKEIEFCQMMLDNKVNKFCGMELTTECLTKHIQMISDEILSIETECKLPHISSLLMMKNELEKSI